MYIELKCRSCNKSFRVDFSHTEFSVEKCPKCAALLDYTDIARINQITESFYENSQRINSVAVCGIHSVSTSSCGSLIVADDLFSSDIEQLSRIYSTASPEVKSRLAAQIDKLYLMVNADAKSQNIDGLDLTLRQLQSMFEERISANSVEL